MTHFILIIAVMVGGRAAAIDHIEYDSKQACDVALAQFWQHEDKGYHDSTVLVCTPKS